MALVRDGDNILKCKEIIDNSFKDFQVYSPVHYPSICLIQFTDVYLHLAPIGYGD